MSQAKPERNPADPRTGEGRRSYSNENRDFYRERLCRRAGYLRHEPDQLLAGYERRHRPHMQSKSPGAQDGGEKSPPSLPGRRPCHSVTMGFHAEAALASRFCSQAALCCVEISVLSRLYAVGGETTEE